MLLMSNINAEKFLKKYLFNEIYYNKQTESKKFPGFEGFNCQGWQEGLSCHPFVSISLVKSEFRRLKVKYHNRKLSEAIQELIDNDKYFTLSIFLDPYFYTQCHKDVVEANVSPFIHWLLNGIYEGRQSLSYLDPIHLDSALIDPKSLKSIVTIKELESRAICFPGVYKNQYVTSVFDGDVYDAYIKNEIPWVINPEQVLLSFDYRHENDIDIASLIELVREKHYE